MIRIFAGTGRQALDLANRIGLKRSEWEHVHRIDSLRGLSKGTIVLEYGTTIYRKDYLEVCAIMRAREYQRIHVPDRGPIPESVLRAIGRGQR